MKTCRFCKGDLNAGFYADMEPIHTRCLALEAMDLATDAQLRGFESRPAGKALSDAELKQVTTNPAEAA